MSFREPTDQMARWLEMLSQFNFQMEYRAGKSHSNADALSRAPCDPESCSCYNGNQILEALPCGGCPHCQKQHAAWSAFVDYEDVIPLITRRVTSKRHVDDGRQKTETKPSTPDAKDKSESRSYINLGINSVLGYFMTILHLLITIFVGSPLFLCKAIRNSCLLPFKSMYVRAVTTRRQALTNERPQNGQGKANGKNIKQRGQVHTGSGSHNLVNNLGFTNVSMSSIQRQDKDVGTILAWLSESNTRPGREKVQDKSPVVRHLWLLWEQLVLIDGVLYKKWADDPTHSHLTLVVPKALFKTILEANHDAVLSGHLGLKKSFSRIRQNYYWYKMKDTVRNYVRACSVCGARKRPHKSPRAPLQNYQQGAPLDRIAMDILGPFPESDQGNKYILVIVILSLSGLRLTPYLTSVRLL